MLSWGGNQSCRAKGLAELRQPEQEFGREGTGRPGGTTGHWTPKRSSQPNYLLWMKRISPGKEAVVQVIVTGAPQIIWVGPFTEPF